MIGYDLDGVLVCDIDISPSSGMDKIFYTRSVMLPLFQPEGDYFILTSRYCADKEDTYKFIEKHFNTKPKFIIHSWGLPDWWEKAKPGELRKHRGMYKAEELKKLIRTIKITAFVESDQSTVELLRREVPEVNIILFKEHIARSLKF